MTIFSLILNSSHNLFSYQLLTPLPLSLPLIGMHRKFDTATQRDEAEAKEIE